MYQKFKSNLKNNLLSGLLVIVPIIITILVLKAIFNFFDKLIYPIINQYFDIYIPGLGILLGLFLIYLIGVFTKNYFGHKLIAFGEGMVVKIPIVKTVYTAVKQILLAFSQQEKSSFKQVLLLEYPRKGIYSLGFLNGELKFSHSKETLLSVLVMTSINPTSGYLVLVPRSQAIFTSLTTEQAMKMIVSGGIAIPKEIGTRE